jgi:hypothetical protein
MEVMIFKCQQDISSYIRLNKMSDNKIFVLFLKSRDSTRPISNHNQVNREILHCLDRVQLRDNETFDDGFDISQDSCRRIYFGNDERQHSPDASLGSLRRCSWLNPSLLLYRKSRARRGDGGDAATDVPDVTNNTRASTTTGNMTTTRTTLGDTVARRSLLFFASRARVSRLTSDPTLIDELAPNRGDDSNPAVDVERRRLRRRR